MARRHTIGLCLAGIATLVLAATACASAAAPSPTPRQEAPPTKAVEAPKPAPTKAPEVAKPTAAPVAKVDFPTKGNPITIIIPSAAGGANDVMARLIAPLLEKDLGTSVQVVNKLGAGGQTGWTELANSKPDGYTIGGVWTPHLITAYLDPERKASFTRKDFQPLAMHVVDPNVFAVTPESPYKTTKDLVDAAKANPGKIIVGGTGILGDDHLAILQFQKLTGTQFAIPQFEGGALAMTAVLGGHIDVYVGNAGETPAQVKAGKIRVLGVLDTQESKYVPGVKTMEAQGYKVYGASSRAVAMPAGAPKEIVNILSEAYRKAIADPEHQKKLDEVGYPVRYMTPAQVEAYWAEQETEIKPLMALAKQ